MKKRLSFIIMILLAWILVFMIHKPIFILYNNSLGNSVSLGEYFQVIYNGLRLDSSVAAYLTVFPLLCIIISVWFIHPVLTRILKGYFLIASIFVSIIFSIDIALYGYWQFRLDASLLFYLESPGDALASIPIGLFFTQCLVFILQAWLIYYLFNRFVMPQFPDSVVHKKTTTTFILLITGCILFLFIRGGVTTSTANIGKVYFCNNQFLNHSAINPCFSFFSSLSKQQNFESQFNFFPEKERKEIVESLLQPLPSSINNSEDKELLTSNRPNILLILLESFSANAIEVLGGEKNITPHLNKLSREGILFTQAYANSFRTDRGLVSILNGYPAQPTTSIMKYPAKSQTLPSIAKSVLNEGYETDMLYGGDINFTNMQSYFFSTGYKKIVSDKNFPINTRLNKWGANDAVTFNYLFESIKTRSLDTPWLTTFLTLSSHEPFDVPYHKYEHPYLNSIAFTDSCLGDFINRFRQLPAWDNTLIILIADHGYPYPDNLEAFEARRFHIPMLWAGGAIKQPEIVDTYFSQTDLATTLLKQLNISTNEFTFSKDIFDTQALSRYAFYTFNNGFGFIDDTGISVYNNDSEQILIGEENMEGKERIKKGKALLQTLYDDLGSR